MSFAVSFGEGSPIDGRREKRKQKSNYQLILTSVRCLLGSRMGTWGGCFMGGFCVGSIVAWKRGRGNAGLGRYPSTLWVNVHCPSYETKRETVGGNGHQA